MRLNEINFSFAGLHCLRDFGAIYVEKSGHPVTPAIRRNEYEISGMPGSVAMPGDLPETLAFSGSLYFLSEPPTQAAAQERLRYREESEHERYRHEMGIFRLDRRRPRPCV